MIQSVSREQSGAPTPAPRSTSARPIAHTGSPPTSALLNPIAPVDLLLSNAGYLITFDNWHNLGYGKAVAIYGPSGKPLASWQLEQLYTRDQLDAIKKSVSSRWWRCSPFHFVDLDEQTKVYVRESLGGYFVFQLPAGKFTYFKGTADCQPSAAPFSATYFR